MRKVISFILGILIMSGGQLLLAKDLEWHDQEADVSGWKRIVLVELSNSVTEKYEGAIGWVSEEMKEETVNFTEELTNQERDGESAEPSEAFHRQEPSEFLEMDVGEIDETIEEKSSQDDNKKEKEEVLGFEAAEQQWLAQAERKLGKKVEWVSLQECFAYLTDQEASLDWEYLWKEERKMFWEKAKPYLSGYVDGFFTGELLSFGEGSVYIAPTTRSVQVNQGGSFRNGRYYPRYVTQYYTTPGYDTPTWVATGRFSLLKTDGSPVWTYQKSANTKQKEWFHKKKQESFFEDFFARVMSRSPLD